MQVHFPAGATVVGYQHILLHMYARVEFPREGLDSFLATLPNKDAAELSTDERPRWINNQVIDRPADWWNPDSVRDGVAREYWQAGNVGVVLISKDDPARVTVYMASY